MVARRIGRTVFNRRYCSIHGDAIEGAILMAMTREEYEKEYLQFTITEQMKLHLNFTKDDVYIGVSRLDIPVENPNDARLGQTNPNSYTTHTSVPKSMGSTDCLGAEEYIAFLRANRDKAR